MGKGRGVDWGRRAPRQRRSAAAIGVVLVHILLHTVAAPAAMAAAAARATGATGANPWQSWSFDGFWGIDRTLADPGALVAGGEVVVYGTTGNHCIVTTCATYWVPRFTSPSMADTAGLRSDAMPALPPWVDPANRVIWAPAVAEIGGTYILYFSATARPGALNAGLKCIGLATAPSAAGPFTPFATALVCGPPGYWAIDPYVVADGADLYLLWREDDAINYLGKIVGAQLAPDGLSLAGAPKRTLVTGEYPWEGGSATALLAEAEAQAATATATDELAAATQDGGPDPGGRRLPPGTADRFAEGAAAIGPIENPAMARHPTTGEWLLTWSANSWNTQSYATGLAICAHPLGPCERVSHDQPWLRTSADASITTTASFGGTGGLSFALGPDSFLYAVFHAYRGTGDSSNSPRLAWVYQVVHDGGGYRFAEFGGAPLMTMSPAH